MAGLEPYRFEPELVPGANEDLDTEDDGSERLENTEWCTCEHRGIMPTARECVCCAEEPESELELGLFDYLTSRV